MGRISSRKSGLSSRYPPSKFRPPVASNPEDWEPCADVQTDQPTYVFGNSSVQPARPASEYEPDTDEPATVPLDKGKQREQPGDMDFGTNNAEDDEPTTGAPVDKGKQRADLLDAEIDTVRGPYSSVIRWSS